MNRDWPSPKQFETHKLTDLAKTRLEGSRIDGGGRTAGVMTGEAKKSGERRMGRRMATGMGSGDRDGERRLWEIGRSEIVAS